MRLRDLIATPPVYATFSWYFGTYSRRFTSKLIFGITLSALSFMRIRFFAFWANCVSKTCLSSLSPWNGSKDSHFSGPPRYWAALFLGCYSFCELVVFRFGFSVNRICLGEMDSIFILFVILVLLGGGLLNRKPTIKMKCFRPTPGGGTTHQKSS